MPRIALSTYSIFLKKNYQEAMQFAVEHGFQGIEIWSNVFDFWPKTVTAGEIDAITALARENHFSLAKHFCAGNNLADINEGHLRESLDQLKETIRLATNHMAEFCYQRYPSDLWLIAAFFMGSVVTAVYGIAHLFITLLLARILWGISYSFIRQAGIMTAVKSGSEAHLGERMGYYRGINAMWRTSGVSLGGLSHDLFGFTLTLITVSIISLLSLPLGALSQKGLKRLVRPLANDVPGMGDPTVILCGFMVGLVGAGILLYHPWHLCHEGA